MIWRSKFRFKIVIWRGSEKILHSKCSSQIMIPKTCNLHPTCTTVVSETNCCCHLLPRLSGFVDVNWAVPLWLPVISEFISVPRHSASSFNSNTVRSCDESPQFGWVWSTLHGCTTRMHKWVDCWLHQCSASTRNMSWGGMKMQVAHLGRPIRLKTWCHSSSFCYHVESTDCVL